MKRAAVWLAITALVACGGTPAPSSSTATPHAGPGLKAAGDLPRLEAAGEPFLARCHQVFGDVAACPTKLPTVDGRYRIRSFDTLSDYRILDVSFSGPYPGLTKRNAPPRFVHLVIKVGDLTSAMPFRIPTERTERVPDEEPKKAVNLGPYTWGTKRGTLVLAPAFPRGGIDGGHLVFTWEMPEGTAALVSLHGWAPVEDAISTLAAIVASIPE